MEGDFIVLLLTFRTKIIVFAMKAIISHSRYPCFAHVASSRMEILCCIRHSPLSRAKEGNPRVFIHRLLLRGFCVIARGKELVNTFKLFKQGIEQDVRVDFCFRWVSFHIMLSKAS